MRGNRQPLPMIREEQLPSFSTGRKEKKVSFSIEKQEQPDEQR